MACAGCIRRQKSLVKMLCGSAPDSILCQKARERLARMERRTIPAPQVQTKVETKEAENE